MYSVILMSNGPRITNSALVDYYNANENNNIIIKNAYISTNFDSCKSLK